MTALAAALCSSATDAASCEAELIAQWPQVGGSIYTAAFLAEAAAEVCTARGLCPGSREDPRVVKEEEWTCEMWADGVIDVLILKTPEIADMLKVNYILKNMCSIHTQ